MLKFDNINKIYPNNVQAVFDFNLEVEEGEFIVFVGPSGCGKSTVLRMIAGLEEISSGTLKIGDKVVNKLAPKDRDISLMFQDYALYGNLTVYENVGMSLTVRHEDPIDVHEKVMPTTKFLGIEERLLNRLPEQLSGGQKQRVALGRAITREPKVFLMDEPLSNLDAKLRGETRVEILKLQRELGITTVYVTHDQVEAMTMADRIVVLKDGHIQQIGTPEQIYNTPNNLFVATFIGAPQINIIKGELKDGKIVADGVTLELEEEQVKLLGDRKNVIVGIRPEAVDVATGVKKNTITMPIDSVEFLGDYSSVRLALKDEYITSRVKGYVDKNQKNMEITFDLTNACFFDPETEEVIR